MSYYDGYAQHAPSATTVLISAPEQPALRRMIETPSGAPHEWIANAFLLSIGADPLSDENAEHFHLPEPHSPYSWSAHRGPAFDDASSSTRASALPGVPYVLEVRHVRTRTPSAGESQVAILEEDAFRRTLAPDPDPDPDPNPNPNPDPDPNPNPNPTPRDHTHPHTTPDPPAASADWQTDPAPMSVHEVNTELTDLYGLVQARFDSSLAVDLGYGIPSHALLVRLLQALPPVRRLALRAHLRQTGLLERPVFTEADAAALSEGLCALIDRIGPDGAVQSDDGWVRAAVLRDVERTLGWTAEQRSRFTTARANEASPGAVLLATARELRLLRRFTGRVVPTNLGKDLRNLPARALSLLADHVAHGSRRSRYGFGGKDAESQRINALVLLSIADGSAASRAEVLNVVTRGAAVLERRWSTHGYRDDGIYWPDADDDSLFSKDSLAAMITRTLDRLIPIGAADSFGDFTPAVRRLAQAALL